MQTKEERRKIRIRRKRRSQTQRRDKKKNRTREKEGEERKRKKRRVHNENLHEIKGTQSNFRSSRVEEKISKTGGQKIKI